MVAQICSSVQLSFIYLNLSKILVHSGRFSCRSQVSYRIFVYYFITRTRATRLAKCELPSRSRQVLTYSISEPQNEAPHSHDPCSYANQTWICHCCCFFSCKGVGPTIAKAHPKY